MTRFRPYLRRRIDSESSGSFAEYEELQALASDLLADTDWDWIEADVVEQERARFERSLSRVVAAVEESDDEYETLVAAGSRH
ncbi:MAG: hypothetical protein WBX15_08620 [Thermoanaerobaculia bacterium]